MTRGAYLMEDPREAVRLERKTEERLTRRLLLLSGLERGQKAIDVGAGTGAVARTMAQLVGPRGRVVALDRSEDRLRHGRALAGRFGQRLSFVRGDLHRLPFPSGAFDFAWCRFVFEYLDRPERALRELTRIVRPGGKVVVGDLDGNGVFHDPIAPAFARDLRKLQAALRGAFDPYAGRKLFRWFRRAGLRDIKVHVEPYHLYPGQAPAAELRNWRLKLEILERVAAPALGGTVSYRRFVKRFLGFLARKDTLTYSVLFLVEGRRPR